MVKEIVQLNLFPEEARTRRHPNWGGKRPGAGRPHDKSRQGAPHRPIPEIHGWTPLHLTISIESQIGRLRRKKLILFFIHVLQEFKNRPGFRFIAWTLQKNHAHLMVEARSKEDLTRTMQSFLPRLAKGWNKILGRTGPVFRGRYFVRKVKDPYDAKRLLAYVLKNHIRHNLAPAGVFDPFSATFWLDVWLERASWRKERKRRGFHRLPPPISSPITSIFQEILVPGSISIYGMPQGSRRDLQTPATKVHGPLP